MWKVVLAELWEVIRGSLVTGSRPNFARFGALELLPSLFRFMLCDTALTSQQHLRHFSTLDSLMECTSFWKHPSLLVGHLMLPLGLIEMV